MRAEGDDWQDWLGRSRVSVEVIEPLRARALQATLDHGGAELADGAPLPPPWHWCYFWSPTPAAELALDGHAARGGFLPPIPLPRRMWAGSRFRFERPLRIGAEVTRQSRILKVRETQGRSGRLAFVTVGHDYGDRSGFCIHEEHDIAYREEPREKGAESLPPGEPAPADGIWRHDHCADPVLLFRYSALTFNSHRIHYDAPYVRDVEGYPGLVVHGPLLATLLIALGCKARPEATLRSFAFRAKRPVFAGQPFAAHGRPAAEGTAIELWISDHEGFVTMQGRAEFDPVR